MTTHFDITQWRIDQLILEKNEPLLQVEKRNQLYPIKYTELWDMYKLHKSAHWVPEEIDLAQDKGDWNNLSNDERHYIKYGLAFFAGSDFIINDSQKKDGQECSILEYSFFNSDKINRENIHSITYANLLEEYISDDTERIFLKDAVFKIPVIKRKAEWMYNYINNGTFVERIIAEAIMEGIFFCSTFASIFWLRKKNKMKGLADSNEFISRDEGMHRDFNVLLYIKYIINKLPEHLLIQMIRDAVIIEQKFVSEALPVSLIGMNNKQMCEYVEYVADQLAVSLINKRIYNTNNPFDWMATISLNIKTEFFSNRPTTYGTTASLVDKEDNKIKFDLDF